MKTLVKKQGNFLHIKEPKKFEGWTDCEYYIEINNQKKRSSQQNNAIHLYCKWIAEELNTAGLRRKALITRFNPSISDLMVDWTAISIKEELWRPVQLAITQKESSTELNVGEVTRIYEQLNAYLSDKGISVPFPSEENKF